MTTARPLDQLAAALVASSVGLHLLMLHHMAPAPAAVMLLMAGACAPCGLALWRTGSERAWATVGVLAGLMLVVHHGATMHDLAGHGAWLSALATGVAVVEVVASIVVLISGRLPGADTERADEVALSPQRARRPGRPPLPRTSGTSLG